jgi:predicted nucleic acid-binding protein
MIVVDASALVDALLRVPGSEALLDRILAPRSILSAPHLIDIEVTQVLRRYCLRGEVSTERAAEAVLDLADFPVDRYPHTLLLPRIWHYRDNLSAYDAAYLALADALDCRVVTRDARFANAPPARGRVELV